MKIRNGFVSNSSSSSFVCKVPFDSEEVTSALKELVRFYGEWMCEDDHSPEFEDMFDPYFEQVDGVLPKEESVYCNAYQTGYLEEHGTFIIRSATSNTVPYELFDLIEKRFDASRIHRG